MFTPSRLRSLLVALVVAAAAVGPAAEEPSHLPAPAFPDVVTLHDRGRDAQALALLGEKIARTNDDDLVLAGEILRAHILAAGQRYAESATAWLAIAGRESSLAHFARRNAVVTYLDAGEIAKAENTLGDMRSGVASRDDTDLMLLLAAAYRTRKAYDDAERVFDSVLAIEHDSARRDEAEIGLASTLEQAGEVETALEVLHRAQAEHHDAWLFQKARVEEARLARSKGLLPEPFACREALPLAVSLRQEARFHDAIQILDGCTSRDSASASAPAMAFEIVNDYYLLRDDRHAQERARAFLAAFPASKLVGGVRSIQQRIAVRQGATAEVRALGLALWRDQSTVVSAAERRTAARLLAAYLVSIGDLDGGLAVYRQMLATILPRTDKIDCLWRAGVAAECAGHHEQARMFLRQALTLRPGSDTAPLVTYWLGVSEAALGDAEESRRLLTSLVSDAPYSYYGIRARQRLGPDLGRLTTETTAAPPAPVPVLTLRDANRQHPYFRAASLLAAAGLTSDAADFARRLARLSPADKALVLVAARASADAGDFHDAWSLAVIHFNWLLQRPAPALPDDLWELAYPRAFWTNVEESARAAKIDPLLMLAVMRQESQFDPRARSSAGALGLFQIMPDKAASLGDAAGVTAPGEEGLVDPRVNSQLAAVLLAQLLKQFDGAPAPVIASFNAGEDRAAIWWRTAGGREDAFVDLIPYNETRRYAREVLAGYATYRRLYGNPERPLRMEHHD
jgi:soluble lytic murein transglycosylase-like protein